MTTIKPIMIGGVNLPLGKSGKFSISRIEVTERDSELSNIRAMMSPGGHTMIVQPGTYTRLIRDGTVVMSDTSMEWRTNLPFLREARGDVLIFGLGIGFVLLPLLVSDEVTSITVVELEEDVIKLVAPVYHKEKLKIVQGDARTWLPEPAQKFDVIYYDIWDDICTDNYGEMKRLTRRSLKYRKKGGKTLCWSRHLIQDEARELRRWFMSRVGGRV